MVARDRVVLDAGEFAGIDVLPGADITITQVISGGFSPTGAAPTSAKTSHVDRFRIIYAPTREAYS